MPYTNFPNGVTSFGIPVLGGASIPFTGTYYFCDPVNGGDGNDGLSPTTAVKTLYSAHSRMTAGKNDVCYLMSNGALSGAAVLSTALAATVDSTATVGTLKWTKNACHLIGIGSMSNNGRAGITSVYNRDGTTYTAATFGGAVPFVDVTGAGCVFKNIQANALFSTGNASMGCWFDEGQRNYYENCQFFGQMDSASAGGTASYSLKVGSGGQGENVFVRCQVGQDTVARTAVNGSLVFAGATPRNSFYDCIFPAQVSGSGSGAFFILGTGNGCIDRWNLFDGCMFANNIKSTSSQMTAGISFTTASPGGMILLRKCDSIGITKWGDTNGLANTFVSNVGGAATDGLMLAPT